ncbi:aminoglycoside phosphotransferase family protein [Kaarinaea lacus]
MPERLGLLTQWLREVLDDGDIEITPASEDASFRRYFRVTSDTHPGQTLIVMDAPPDKEDTAPFIAISRLLVDAGVHAPEVMNINSVQGFLLLTDLGSQPYLDALNDTSVDELYGDALDTLLRMQRDVPHETSTLPPYDLTLLLREMELFREWYLAKYRNLALTDDQQHMLDAIYQRLAESALSQPEVFVHRDYHSRNLMVTQENNPGVLDFQDAVIGPLTYDLVSLLRDCYIQWPRERVEKWALAYLHQAAGEGVFELSKDMTDEVLLRWFDWMGVQRHLKASGIFARLWLRDGKPGYLDDIPRTLGYVREVCSRYEELFPLYEFLESLDDQ